MSEKHDITVLNIFLPPKFHNNHQQGYDNSGQIIRNGDNHLKLMPEHW